MTFIKLTRVERSVDYGYDFSPEDYDEDFDEDDLDPIERLVKDSLYNKDNEEKEAVPEGNIKQDPQENYFDVYLNITDSPILSIMVTKQETSIVTTSSVVYEVLESPLVIAVKIKDAVEKDQQLIDIIDIND